MVIGGHGDLDVGFTATVEILVDLDGTWRKIAPFPVTRAYAQAVTWNNIVYVIGKIFN